MIRFLSIILPLFVTLSLSAQSITHAEYFWGDDPGVGNGTAMVAEDGSFGSAIETVLAQNVPMTELGSQLFSVRVREASGAWGPVFKVVIHGEASITTTRNIRITQAEYFWNADPGFGSGSTMFAFDGNYDDAIETLVNNTIPSPVVGTHVLFIRARDAENEWSAPFGVVVNVEPNIITTRQVFVSAGEYWFNDDPGAGNATPMLALDGNFNSAIEKIKGGGIPAPITAGIHVLWMRARGADNQWSPPFGVVVNMDTTIAGFNVAISGPVQFCQGQSLVGASYSAQASGGSTYTWVVTNGVIVNGQGTANVTVNWNPSGNRTLTLTQCVGADCDTDMITLVINPSYNLVASATICQGQSIFLGGANQTQAGQYTDVYQSVNGCDSTIVTTLSVVTQLVNNVTAAICQGQSIFLGGANQTQPGQYTDTYQSSAGCDSLVVTQLSVNPTYYFDDAEVTICPGESAFLGGDFQTIPGFYTDVFETEFGCDSVVVTNLIAVNNPVPVISQVGINLQTGSYASYQWLLNGVPINGATNQTWEPLENGNYTVQVVDANGCTGISAVFQVVSVSVQTLGEIGVLQVFPNPTRGEVWIQWPVSIVNPIVQVLDATGRIVAVESGIVENRMNLNLSGFARGTYTIRLLTDENSMITRVVLM
jgi:hypothetical protein